LRWAASNRAVWELERIKWLFAGIFHTDSIGVREFKSFRAKAGKLASWWVRCVDELLRARFAAESSCIRARAVVADALVEFTVVLRFFVTANCSHKRIPRKEEHFALDGDWWASAWIAFDNWPPIGTGAGLGFLVKNVAIFTHWDAFTGSKSGMIGLVNFIVSAREGALCLVRSVCTHAVFVISSVVLVNSTADDLVFDKEGVLPFIASCTIASGSWEVSIFANAHILLVIVDESVSAADKIVFLVVESVLAFETVTWEATELVDRDRWVAADGFHAVPANTITSVKIIFVRPVAFVSWVHALAILIRLGHVRAEAFFHLAFIPRIFRAADELWESKRCVESFRALSTESHIVNRGFIGAETDSGSNVIFCSLRAADNFWF